MYQKHYRVTYNHKKFLYLELLINTTVTLNTNQTQSVCQYNINKEQTQVKEERRNVVHWNNTVSLQSSARTVM